MLLEWSSWQQRSPSRSRRGTMQQNHKTAPIPEPEPGLRSGLKILNMDQRRTLRTILVLHLQNVNESKRRSLQSSAYTCSLTISPAHTCSTTRLKQRILEVLLVPSHQVLLLEKNQNRPGGGRGSEPRKTIRPENTENSGLHPEPEPCGPELCTVSPEGAEEPVQVLVQVLVRSSCTL